MPAEKSHLKKEVECSGSYMIYIESLHTYNNR